MKKLSILVFIIFAIGLQATTMRDLFDAIKRQPTSKIDRFSEQMATIAKDKVDSNYFPKINLFANYTHYNYATNLLPVDPKSAGKLIAMNQPLPFAKTIQRVGIMASVPIFVKELGILSKKTKYLLKGAKLKKELNFYKNEAVVLGSNAGLEYLKHLKQTLDATKRSILKMKSDTQIAINNGRIPGIAKDKIDEKLNQLEIGINNIKIKQSLLLAQIQNLTGLSIDGSLPMKLVKKVDKGEFFATKLLQQSINASQSDLMVAKAKRYYPKLAFNVMWSENYAQNDANKNTDVHRSYGYYQIGALMPLYDRSGDVDIQLKKIALMKNRMRLNKTKQELSIEAQSLKKELALLKKSIDLTKENIQKKKNLLEFAKVAFKEGRMTEEDYLRYEDGLLGARSSYYQIISKKWQDIAKLAVIYGNDLRGVVR